MKILPHITSFLIISLFSLPLFVSGQSLIVCDGGGANPCTFEHFILLIKNGINLLVKVATLVTVLALAYMGFTLMTSGGNEGARKEVQARGKAILIGYLWIVAAWLIVYTIMKVLVDDKYILLGKPSTN